jgi:hypothetical protein
MNKLQNRSALVVALASPLSAFAQTAPSSVPAGVVTAVEGMGAGPLWIAGIVLVAIVALAAFKFMRKGL